MESFLGLVAPLIPVQGCRARLSRRHILQVHVSILSFARRGAASSWPLIGSQRCFAMASLTFRVNTVQYYAVHCAQKSRKHTLANGNDID